MHRSTFESEVGTASHLPEERLDWTGSAVHSVDTLLASLGKLQGIFCNLCDRDNFSSRKSTSDGKRLKTITASKKSASM